MSINTTRVMTTLSAIGSIASLAPLFFHTPSINLSTFTTIATVAQQISAAIGQIQAAQSSDSRREAVITAVNGILASFQLSPSQALVDAIVQAVWLVFEPAPPPAAPSS